MRDYEYSLSSQSYGFPSSHVQMLELDHKEGWALKNWCFWTVVLEKTLESLLDRSEIKPVHSKGNQPWIIHWKDWCWSWSSGHLMWRAHSWDKTLVLGKIEGRRRRGQQRTRWLDSVDMSLSTLWEIVKEGNLGGYSPRGHKELDTTQQLDSSNSNRSIHVGLPACSLREKVVGPYYTSTVSTCPFVICILNKWTSLVAQMVKLLPTMWETWVQSLGQEDPLEKETATHSSILAWKIPWMEEPGGLQSMGSQRVGHDWVTSLFSLCISAEFVGYIQPWNAGRFTEHCGRGGTQSKCSPLSSDPRMPGSKCG